MATMASSTQLADGRLLGLALEMRPAGFLRHPEDVFGAVFVGIFGVGPFVLGCQKLLVHLLERVGDVLQEDQPQDDVLILRRIHVVAELVGGEPQLGLESKVGPIAVASGDCSRLLLAHLTRFRFCESCRFFPIALLAHAGDIPSGCQRGKPILPLWGVHARNPTPDSRQFEVEGGGQPPSSPWECGGALHEKSIDHE